MKMNKWTPESNQMILRRVGKTSEELAELMKVCSRIIIQGFDGIDPVTKESNKDALTKEIADVMAQCILCMEHLDLDEEFITDRAEEKTAMMIEWESLFKEK